MSSMTRIYKTKRILICRKIKINSKYNLKMFCCALKLRTLLRILRRFSWISGLKARLISECRFLVCFVRSMRIKLCRLFICWNLTRGKIAGVNLNGISKFWIKKICRIMIKFIVHIIRLLILIWMWRVMLWLMIWMIMLRKIALCVLIRILRTTQCVMYATPNSD